MKKINTILIIGIMVVLYLVLPSLLDSKVEIYHIDEDYIFYEIVSSPTELALHNIAEVFESHKVPALHNRNIEQEIYLFEVGGDSYYFLQPRTKDGVSALVNAEIKRAGACLGDICIGDKIDKINMKFGTKGEFDVLRVTSEEGLLYAEFTFKKGAVSKMIFSDSYSI
jgi:hypothetical protein